MKPKNTSYFALSSEVAKLQERAAAARARELPGVLDTIMKSMESYNIKVEDIEKALASNPGRRLGETRHGRRASPAGKQRVSSVAPKYLDPATGDTWTGRGRAPLWLVAAEAAGRDRQTFAIAPPAAE